MHARRATRTLMIFSLSLSMALAFSSNLAAQQPPHCAQIIFCLYDQGAVASDPAGIHKYSENLIGLIVPNPAEDNSVRRFSNDLADRLATEEQAARAGKRKLVPEAAVVKAFNDLMQGIGAPPSMRTNEAAVHGFREHAASIKAFPALFTADRNGTNCNPGEAVFLLSLLLSNNGVLYEGNLDSAKAQIHWDDQRNRSKNGVAVFHMEVSGSSASVLLSSYLSHSNRNANFSMFNNMVALLGF